MALSVSVMKGLWELFWRQVDLFEYVSFYRKIVQGSGSLPFINLQVPASGLCSSLILEESKLMVGDANILHHSSILPWEPAKQKVDLFSPHDFMSTPPMRARGISCLTFGQLARTEGTNGARLLFLSFFFLRRITHIHMLGKGRWNSISRMYLFAERVVGGLVRGSNTSGQSSWEACSSPSYRAASRD